MVGVDGEVGLKWMTLSMAMSMYFQEEPQGSNDTRKRHGGKMV